jgi:hypothetical protein
MYYNDEVIDELLETTSNSSFLQKDLYDSSTNDKYKYYKLKRVRQTDTDKYNKPVYSNVTIKAYPSGQTGTCIVNAVSGYTSRCKVGSNDEKLFYTVAICTGEGRNREPISLYYDSPQQYEEHFLTSLDNDIKEQWTRKNKRYIKQLRQQ